MRLIGLVLKSLGQGTGPHINMAEAQKKKTTDAMQVKLVFHGPGGRRVEVRRFEVEGKPTITSIKDKVAELRPQMSVFTLGWRDEEDDMVVVETEEELGIALKQMAGDLLSIHVMDKMVDGDAEKAARVGQRSMIRMPEEYKVQVKELERRLVEQEVAVAVNVLSKEELIAAVKKQPGVLFVRGLGIEGEKPGNENNANVWRIMEARRVLEMSKEVEVALLFVPTRLEGEESMGAQVTNNWKSIEGPTVVAFKRRGWGEDGGRRERGTTLDREQRRRLREEGGRRRLRAEMGLGKKEGKEMGLGKMEGKGNGCWMPRRRAKMLAGAVLDRLEVHI